MLREEKNNGSPANNGPHNRPASAEDPRRLFMADELNRLRRVASFPPGVTASMAPHTAINTRTSARNNPKPLSQTLVHLSPEIRASRFWSSSVQLNHVISPQAAASPVKA